MGTIEDQPQPTAQPEQRPVWDHVIEELSGLENQITVIVAQLGTPLPPGVAVFDVLVQDMRARDAAGRERYGVPLTTRNGRDQLVDAYQETLDAVVYMRASIEESVGQVREILMRTYAIQLALALSMRVAILGRDAAKAVDEIIAPQ